VYKEKKVCVFVFKQQGKKLTFFPSSETILCFSTFVESHHHHYHQVEFFSLAASGIRIPTLHKPSEKDILSFNKLNVQKGHGWCMQFHTRERNGNNINEKSILKCNKSCFADCT